MFFLCLLYIYTFPIASFYFFGELTEIGSKLGLQRAQFRSWLTELAQPSECGRQRTLNIIHAQTAAQQQSNGSYEARMSGKCGEWRY